jgi:hypothetical protein
MKQPKNQHRRIFDDDLFLPALCVVGVIAVLIYSFGG